MYHAAIIGDRKRYYLDLSYFSIFSFSSSEDETFGIFLELLIYGSEDIYFHIIIVIIIIIIIIISKRKLTLKADVSVSS